MIFGKRILKIFWGLIVVLLITFSLLVFRIYNQSRIDEREEVDTIVVLGAAQWNRNPSPVFKARLDHAFNLYRSNYASKIILTGGVGEKEPVSESLVGKNYLIKKGVAEEVIYIEEQGQTSWQSLNQVAQILEEQNLESVILVSDGFQMMRLKKMANNLDIEALASPARDSLIAKNRMIEFKYVLREAVVYIAYLLFKI